MAVFDTIRCFHGLPISRARQWVFQTRDTPDPAMRQYIIRADGQLWRDAGKRRWKSSEEDALVAQFAVTEPRWVRDSFSGTMTLSAPMGEDLWLTLVAVFENGQLQGVDVPAENRISLSAADWDWLEASLGSEKERTPKFVAALERWQAQSQARRKEEQAESIRIVAIADSLMDPCVDAGWGAADDLQPLLQAAASSIAADWGQHRSDQDRAHWLEEELAAWFGRESVDALPQEADLVARVDEALHAGLGLRDDQADTTPATTGRHWNYRVFRVQAQGDDEPTFELREAHYEGGRMVAWTQRAATPDAESLEGLRWVLQRMLEATWKPFVDHVTNDVTAPQGKGDQHDDAR